MAQYQNMAQRTIKTALERGYTREQAQSQACTLLRLNGFPYQEAKNISANTI